MDVQILYVKDFGTHDSERLVLKVIEDTDIGQHIAFDTTYTADGKISNKVRHSYWFPDKKVKKGDLVLYTRKGENESVLQKDKSTTHFFYWGLGTSVWNDEGDCAVLMSIDEWAAKKANE